MSFGWIERKARAECDLILAIVLESVTILVASAVIGTERRRNPARRQTRPVIRRVTRRCHFLAGLYSLDMRGGNRLAAVLSGADSTHPAAARTNATR
jgi:hypothetical protein